MSAQVIDALRRRADTLEADADSQTGMRRHVAFIPEAMVVTPGLLRWLAAEFRALADEAERMTS